MPPRKRTETEVTYSAAPVPPKDAQIKSFINEGDLVNVVSNGRTHQNYEVLGLDDRFIKFRADMSVAPQTEVVLIPYAQIEAIGLVNER